MVEKGYKGLMVEKGYKGDNGIIGASTCDMRDVPIGQGPILEYSELNDENLFSLMLYVTVNN